MDVDVIIPAYNESESIAAVLDALPRRVIRHVVVSDNGSTDQTATLAKAHRALVTSAPNRGYGNACLAGIDYIRTNFEPPDFVVFLDGDYSDYPEDIQLLLDKQSEGYDLVLGSRNDGAAAVAALAPHQRFGNKLAVSLIKLLHGHTYQDLGPFRLIRWQALMELDMEDRNYGWTVEMQLKALQHNLKIAEVPVRYRPRIGKSKISGTIKGSVMAGIIILSTILKYSWAKNKKNN